LIKKDIEGNWQRSFERIRTTDAIKDAAIHSAHTKDLALIQKSLEEVPLNWRDVTSITMPIDTKKLTEAKRLIRQFQDDLSELLESGESNEVYRMSIALFPLSEIPSRKREFIK
ncbi:MAG: TIGR02147 family protein, partial [Proteobacteria bacterium]|nr:TIGR02147 family protein [Pseudomonadota bacterium]